MIDLKKLWEAMPPDVQRKMSLHDLKRIADNYNGDPPAFDGESEATKWLFAKLKNALDAADMGEYRCHPNSSARVQCCGAAWDGTKLDTCPRCHKPLQPSSSAVDPQPVMTPIPDDRPPLSGVLLFAGDLTVNGEEISGIALSVDRAALIAARELPMYRECIILPNIPSQPAPLDRVFRALRDLFRNPMPHDLISIRREVENEYGGDDEAAKCKMDAWCSQEFMEQKITAHREAWHNAADVLRQYGANETIPTKPH